MEKKMLAKLLAGLVLLATVSTFGPTRDPRPAPVSAASPAEPPETLVAAYLSCSRESRRRVLPPEEALACAGYYLNLKLSLLKDMEPATYHALPTADRATVNRRAYAAYLEWRKTNAARLDTLTLAAASQDPA